MTHRSTITAILFAATAAMAPAPLFAQITTFVAPPRSAKTDTTNATVAATPAQRDTMTRMTLGNMKAWVDSAAGVGTSASQVAAADTTMTPMAQTPASPTPSRAGTTTFSNGAIAPNTASPLPFYLAAGVLLIFVGLGTLRLARVSTERRERDA